MKIADSISIMKALADGSRLMIMKALLDKPQYVEELAQRLNLAPSTVSFHLKKMETARLVRKTRDQYYLIYEVNLDLFDRTLKELISFTDIQKFVQDERIARHRSKVLKAFFKDSQLRRLPTQHKKRLIVLEEFARKFRPDRIYDEVEVDAAIAEQFNDYCTIRRELVEERYLKREGARYWVVNPVTREGATEHGESLAGITRKKSEAMRTRAEIKREYKETPKIAGVFKIENKANGKVLLGSSLNLHGPLNRYKFELQTGVHAHQELQEDWTKYGPENFVFDIVETVKVKDDPNFNILDELTLLEQVWLEKLQPYGEKGYMVPGERMRI
jgi:DNA-binding HxlR family transcriptional regulator